MTDRPRVAAIATIYFPSSHADVIVTKFMKGMSTDEGFFPPEVELVSLYLDHVLENDIGAGLARQFGVPLYPSIRRALHPIFIGNGSKTVGIRRALGGHSAFNGALHRVTRSRSHRLRWLGGGSCGRRCRQRGSRRHSHRCRGRAARREHHCGQQEQREPDFTHQTSYLSISG